MYLRTKDSVHPVIISPGQAITLAESLVIMRTCVDGYRIPRPTRRAHELVNEFRRSEMA
jgi:deoxyribonuclease V